jgi:hypothetical protein
MRTVKATPKLNKNEYLQNAGWTRRVLQQVNLAVSVASTAALQLGHELPPARRHTHPNTTREPSALLHRVSLPPSLFAFAQAMRSWRVLWSAAASLVRGAVNSWRLTSARATYERNVYTQQKSDRWRPIQKEEERKSATSTIATVICTLSRSLCTEHGKDTFTGPRVCFACASGRSVASSSKLPPFLRFDVHSLSTQHTRFAVTPAEARGSHARTASSATPSRTSPPRAAFVAPRNQSREIRARSTPQTPRSHTTAYVTTSTQSFSTRHGRANSATFSGNPRVY